MEGKEKKVIKEEYVTCSRCYTEAGDFGGYLITYEDGSKWYMCSTCGLSEEIPAWAPAFQKRRRQVRDRINKLPVSSSNFKLLEEIGKKLNI